MPSGAWRADPSRASEIVRDAIVQALKDAAPLLRSEVLSEKVELQVLERPDVAGWVYVSVRVPVMMRFR